MEFIRKVLGVGDYKPGKSIKEIAEGQLEQVQPESIPLEELPQAADQTREIVKELVNVGAQNLKFQEAIT